MFLSYVPVSVHCDASFLQTELGCCSDMEPERRDSGGITWQKTTKPSGASAFHRSFVILCPIGGILRNLWCLFCPVGTFFLSWMFSTVLKASVDVVRLHVKDRALCCDSICTPKKDSSQEESRLWQIYGRKMALIIFSKCMFTLRSWPYFFQLDMEHLWCEVDINIRMTWDQCCFYCHV